MIYYSLLDLLRFLSAFSVMGFHYFFGFLPITDQLSVWRYGNFGVQIFFVISGFVISQSISEKSIRDFAIGRFIRLYPLFWIICTATFIFTLIMPNGQAVHFPEYLASMTMMGDKFSQAIGYGGLVDPSYWSLAVELTFYFAIGFFVYLFSWKNIRYFLGGWLLVSALSYLLKVDHNFLMKLILVRHASYFIFGATLALIAKNNYQNLPAGRQVYLKIYDYLFLIVVGIYSTLISFKALPPYFAPNKLDDTIIAILHPVSFILVILAIYFSKYFQNGKVKKVLIILGGLTYPLYLIHQTVGRILIDYFKDYGTLFERQNLMIILMLVISYFAYTQDKKLRNYLKIKMHLKKD